MTDYDLNKSYRVLKSDAFKEISPASEPVYVNSTQIKACYSVIHILLCMFCLAQTE